MTTEMEVPVDFKVSVVLPAGGSGQRFGCIPPKQFATLLNEPLICHTLSTFHRIPWIQEIVVVVGEDFRSNVTELVSSRHLDDKVTVVAGSDTRHRSIYAGVKAVKPALTGEHVVVIHDVVRVFADLDTIQQVVMAAKTQGAAGVTRPLVSTVIAVDNDGILQDSLDRRLYRASEMPQAFTYNVINMAYQQATELDFEHGTECLLLAMKYTGIRAKLIEGPNNLWKVTYKKDLYAAEGMLKEQHLRCAVITPECKEMDGLFNVLAEQCKVRSIFMVPLPKQEPTTEYQTSCNSFVYVSSNFEEKMLHNTNRHILRSRRGLHIAPCFVYVLHGVILTQSHTEAIMDYYLNRAKLSKDVLIYCIINEDSGDLDTVSNMAVSLLWNREPALSGQTFIIKKLKS